MMAYQNLRAGIIGGGWIARVHVPAIDAAPGVELVAACDTEIARAEAIAGPRGGRAYTRWEEMLEREELDVLWVCPPPLFHRGPVVAALAAGVHVYLEKPIARTLDDADAIVEAAAGSSAICAVGYQWHASELLDDALELLAGQQVGLLVGRNFGPVAGRPWFMDRAQGGGQILERGSHHIDLQRALAGEIAAVGASAGSVGLSLTDAPSGIEDAISLTFHFESGALGSVHSAWTREGQPQLFAVDIVATDATLALQLGPGAYRLTGSSRGVDVATEHGGPMDRSIARFLEAARSGDASRVVCSPADARATLAVALACERSLASGGRVTVDR
jgi:myo-inositol 2-dehydrogenase / D-chiro-inositol 1-dehydrogenase